MKAILMPLFFLLAFIANAQQDYVPNKLLVQFGNDIAHQLPSKAALAFGIISVDQLNQRNNCTEIRTIARPTGNKGGAYLLTYAQPVDVPALVKQYMATGAFTFAEPDYIAMLGGTAPNDTLFAKQWSLHNDGSFTGAPAKAGADINMLAAWDITEGDSSVIVAVLDAGLKMDHPEFAGRLWVNKNEIPANGIDDDNNGFTDDINGWNFVSDTADCTDDNGHGTNVTGIIGANANNITGYAGVDHKCKLMVVKAANAQGFYDYAWMAGAIHYAIDNGANIMNISAGGATSSNIVKNAVDTALAKNITIVAAMMNSNAPNPFYPAAYPGVIAVGATGPTDKRANFSNYGPNISLCAPGEFIYGLSHLYDTAFGLYYSGTSQATPHVAGVAALLLAQNKNRTPAQIKQILETTADDMVGDTAKDKKGWDKYYGAGRLNAYRALTNDGVRVKENIKPASEWTVFPNPATDNITIINTIAQPYSINIVNMQGQVVYATQVNAAQQSISLQNLSAGTYLLRLHNKDNAAILKLQLR